MSAVRLFAALLVPLAGCASVADATRHDREQAFATIDARLEHASPRLDGEAAEAWVGELLADGLSEDDAVQIALVASPRIAERAARLGIASAELVQAGRLPNPVLGANAKFFSAGTELELGIVQPIFALLARSARTAASRSQRDREQVEFAREAIHLAFEVRRAFADHRAARELVTLRESDLELEQGSFALVQSLHGAGNFDDRGLALAEALLSEARLRLASAQLAHSEAREPLNRLLGLWGQHADWEPQDPSPEEPAPFPSVEDAEPRALRASLELEAQRARVDGAARRAGVESRSAMLGDASVGLAAKRETDGAWGLGPSLELSLPLFDRGQAVRTRAGLELEREVQAHRALEVEIRSAARTLVLRAQAAHTRAEYLHGTHVSRLGAVVREELRQYNAMQIGVFDVLRARARELDAEARTIEARLDARKARLDLAELFAGSLPEARPSAGMDYHDAGERGAGPTDEEHR